MGDLFDRLCDSAQTRNEWLNTDKPIPKGAISVTSYALPKPFNKRTGDLEKDLLKAFQEKLRNAGYVVCRLQNQGVIQRTGGGDATLRGSSQTGMPDIIAMREGHFYMFELKAPGGRVKADQLSRLLEWKAEGAHCAIVVTLDGWFSVHNSRLQGIQVF